MALSKVSTEKASNDSQNSKITDKKEKPPTKVIVRRLPPHMTEEEFINHVSPIPDYDYMYMVKGDMSLGENAFARVYINFTSIDDVYIFNEKFDNYVFIDAKGHEYKAVVEFASFQKIPRRRKPRPDPKCASLESDPLYIEFVNSLNEPEPSLEEKPEYTFQPNTDNKNDVSTPLLDYLKQRKVEKQKMREEKREERRKKDIERKRLRDDERRKRFEDKSPKKDGKVETVEEVDKKARWTKPERVKNGTEKDKEEKPVQFTEKNFVNSKLKKAHKGEPFEEHKEYRNRREREYKPKMERKTFEERKENDRKTYEDRKDDRKTFEERKDSERKTFEDRKDNERKTYEDRKDDRKMFEERKDDRKTFEERKENESKPPVVSRKVKKYSERREERKSEAKKAEKLSEVKEEVTEKTVVEKVSLEIENTNLESTSTKVETNDEETFENPKEDPKEVVEKKKEEKVEKYSNEEPSCSKERYIDNEDSLEGNEERPEHRKRNKENDPRVQRRIRNKDRPTMAIYQPGMLKKKPESSQTSEKEDN